VFVQRRIRFTAVAAATALLALAPGAAPAAADGKRSVVFKPAKTSSKAVTFKLRGIRAQRVVRASLVRKGKVRRRLGERAARRAAHRGVLRVQVRSSRGQRRMGRFLAGASARKPKRMLWVRPVARTTVKLRVVTDTRAPQTSVTSGPTGTVDTSVASFGFRSDEKRSTFDCRVDAGDWRACSSPMAFTDVPAGDHTFSVRARDRAGNVDQSPATRDWTVAAPPQEEPPAEESAETETPVEPVVDAPVEETAAPVVEAPPVDASSVLFSDGFTGLNGVITNHYAFWSPDDDTAFRSDRWEMESGCALRRDNTLWSGVPTANEPNKDCSNGSGSEVFRLWTKRTDFGNVAVSMQLRNNGYAVGSQGERSWDGVKIWLRRQGASGSHGLYTVEVNRRQGNIMIQKKCANSDEYHILEQGRPEGAAASVGAWESVGGSVKNQGDGTVKLTMVRHGKTVMEATDSGVGCAPITSAGRVGFRGDSTDFNVDDFTVAPAV
jgi:hypothetical protein